MNPVYEPREDSELLAKCISTYAKKAKRVLDMGTGSGYLASIAAIYGNEIVAADINPKAIEYAKLHHPIANIQYIESDLFANIKGKFDLIMFNTPYLPKEEGLTDLALDGGEHGWEVIGEFLKPLAPHLEEKGVVLMLFSSLSNKEKVEELIEEHKLKGKCIARQKLFFEELYVYELTFL